MLTATASRMPFVWLSLAATGVYGSAFHQHAPYHNTSSCSTSTQTLPGTIPPPQTSTIEYSTSSECTAETETSVLSTVVVSTSSPSSTPHYTNTTIDSTTTTALPYSTKTVTAATYSTTILTSSSTTTVLPSTITSSASFPSYTFSTSTVYQECPTTCSISAGTVNLFFWPTNNDYSYPATYVDTSLDYTFTSPSVYMLINTIYGTNSLGRTGPSATSTIFALDLDEVSTIVPGGSATRQLSLSDLGTDCPQSADPTAILTMTDSRCDPTLVAPNIVKAWARPCNACGRFGLFDPPYAIPTITGGLLGTTTATAAVTRSTATAATGATSTVAATTQTAVTTASAVTTPTATAATTAAEAVTTTSAISLGPSGLVVVYYYSGTSSTATIPETGSVVTYGTQTFTLSAETATQTSIATTETSSAPTVPNSGPSSTALTGDTATSTAVTTTSASDSSTASAATTVGDPGSTASAVPTASTTKLRGHFTLLVMSILASICML